MKKRVLLVLVLCAVVVPLSASRRRPVTSDPTFSRHVVRIFQRNCQTCHRPDGVAPFSLTTFDSARPWAYSIAAMTAARKMPPWPPSENCGTFDGKRGLTDSEIETLQRWASAGAPEGDRRDLPEPLEFNDDWTFGAPDEIIAMPERYTPSSVKDDFRMFPLARVFEQETYVAGFDIHPGARRFVHHILVHVDASGGADAQDAADPLPGYDIEKVGQGFEGAGFLGTWVPGQQAQFSPPGIAARIPAGSKIVLEIHYHPHHGMIEPDQTEIGLYFAREPVQQPLYYGSINNADFTIPAGARHHPVQAIWNVDRPVRLRSLGAHMHYLGEEMTVRAFLPTGGEICLLTVRDWDPKWQGLYTFSEPVALPAGTKVVVDGYFDNSASNPRNPNNPPIEVRSGARAVDEMCIAFLTYTVDGE